MEIVLELNQKYKKGYQLRMILEGINKALDEEPYTLYEAATGADIVLQEANRSMGTTYQLNNILRITDNALQVNKNIDLASKRMALELNKKKPEYKTVEVDGQEELAFNAHGVVTVCYLAWKDDAMPKGRQFMQEYCNYLSSQRYGKGASQIMAELEAMSTDDGIKWIDETYNRYIKSDYVVMDLFQKLSS